MLGAAEKPGVYYLTGPTTLLEILSKAGGFASTAGKQVISCATTRAPEGCGERESRPAAQPGEDPGRRPGREHPRAEPGHHHRVQGAGRTRTSSSARSRSPAGYTLDKETNILEGITIAGGFTDKAAPSRTRVIRSTPEGQKVIEVDMNDILRRGREAKTVMLQESDVVVVPESFF